MVDIPFDRKNSSHSASTNSTTTSSPSLHSPTSALHPTVPQCAFGGLDPFVFTHPHANHHHLHRVHYMPSRNKPPNRLATNGVPGSSSSNKRDSRESGGGSPTSDKSLNSPTRQSDSVESWSTAGDDVWVSRSEGDYTSSKSDTGLLDRSGWDRIGGHRGYKKDEPYVIIEKSKTPGAPHEYSYPNLEPVNKPPAKREATTSKKPQVGQPYPLLPYKAKGGGKKKGEVGRHLVPQRARCKHCRVMFTQDENVRGSCDSAPDTMGRCIEYVSCVTCTKALMYHCMADADGEYRHPCECDASDERNCRKWTALTILSFFLPCLWCYLPLHACHRCGVECGACGGRHKAA